MTPLEHEIMEKFRQLQPAAKRRILALIEHEVAAEIEPPFDYDAWFRDVEAIRQEIRAASEPIDVVGMLREIRDGEDN
jgi:hypothetical protein